MAGNYAPERHYIVAVIQSAAVESSSMPKDMTKKLEYRIRFDAQGTILGESSHSHLADHLGFNRSFKEVPDIFSFVQRTAILDKGLPGRLEPLLKRLLENQEEFALNGDFSSNGEKRHLRISGQSIRNVNGDVTHTLLFLDDTVHTQLRRSYEYMFRLANHEIKGPLAVVLGATEHAHEHVESGNKEGVLSCLAMIERNARAIEEMIVRYLNLSRIESGMMPVHNEDLMLSTDVIHPLLAETQMALAKKGMRIQFDCVGLDREPLIHGSRELLEIVLRNLLSNAVKYGDENSTIELAMTKQGNDCVVSVENAGPNIPKENLSRLFQRFVRLDATQGTKGSGLGLYNARKLVEMWGGLILVESAERVTRFVFTIPQEKAAQSRMD